MKNKIKKYIYIRKRETEKERKKRKIINVLQRFLDKLIIVWNEKKGKKEREREKKIKNPGGLMDDVRSTRDISASLCPSVDK